jgi:pyruvate ferredoxin oxidoreductase alpha subunit
MYCDGGRIMGKDMMMGSDAVAFGVKLAKPEVMFAYPITPQTHIIETLSEIADSWGAKFVNVESEFSAIASCYGAVAAGSRAFTATSSHGLLLMHEVLHWFVGARMPLVMVNANRSVGSPWNIWADQSDSMAQRDTGWLQIYCETCQEALDTIIQAYYVSEKLLLPVMVMIDGFILSHTMEEVEVHDQGKVDAFLPPYEAQFKLDVDDPRSFGNATPPDNYYRFRKAIQRDLISGFKVLEDSHDLFADIIGTRYDLIEVYRCEDAESIFLVSGALTGTTREAVNMMREKGMKVGLVKLRVFRPFPKDALRQVLTADRSVIVLNRAISYGAQGTLSQELRSAFYNIPDRPDIYDVIISLGGKEVFPETLMQVCDEVKKNPQFKDETLWV